MIDIANLIFKFVIYCLIHDNFLQLAFLDDRFFYALPSIPLLETFDYRYGTLIFSFFG